MIPTTATVTTTTDILTEATGITVDLGVGLRGGVGVALLLHGDLEARLRDVEVSLQEAHATLQHKAIGMRL